LYDDIHCYEYWVAMPPPSLPNSFDVNPDYKLQVWLLTISNTSGYFEFGENYWVNLLWSALPAAIFGSLVGAALTNPSRTLKLSQVGLTLMGAAAYIGATHILSGLWMAVRMDCWPNV
jgi:hypothetical protein